MSKGEKEKEREGKKWKDGQKENTTNEEDGQ
jgi:hypothetical protein